MLSVRDITVSFDEVLALRGASLEAPQGRTLAVLGPSGCGKTTLLRVVAGLQRQDSGLVVVDGTDLGETPAHARGVGLMFQDNALFPHRDVAGNVAFGLRMAGLSRRESASRVHELLALVGLPGTERRTVQTLSGGEQQRVALARALAPQPRVLLLDEPLGSLDGPLRERLLDDLRDLFERLGLTVVYVTHDVGEAFSLGHAVAVMREGLVVQTGEPDDLWAAPADDWVARFLGMRNLRHRGERSVLIRPDAVLVEPGEGAVVVSAQRRGAVVRLRIRLDEGEELETTTTAAGHPRSGDRVAVSVDPAGIVDLRRYRTAGS
jgi:thiamine transport system ATP-binding protein